MLKQYVRFQVWQATRQCSKGQSLAEYGLIIALIAVVCITALTLLGNNLSAKLNCLAGAIAANNSAGC